MKDEEESVNNADDSEKINNFFPTFYGYQLEESVGDYLDLPYRSKMVDRLLVDALMHMG